MEESVILIVAADGWFTCPGCHKNLLRITRATTAENLPIWCPRCHKEYTIEIQRDRSA